ncbi:translation initiation factor IF-2-like [Amphibalanus amphitrite]|uniref:translation initiation factor IF-2-like n=1 Tax=Amphibalanus amphitrite TaxID=1232801 RepID=UPI001C8FAEE1|nr:translation initiation factor IF-2-like [Amphibalanus amphitrite]
MGDVRPKCSWAEKETAALLRLAIDKKIFEKFDGKKVTNRQVYNDLSVSLRALNVEATAEQIKIKLKNMKRLYQERRRKMSRSGAAAAPPLQHQELLDELLASRPSTAAASGEMGLDFTFTESAPGPVDQASDSTDPWEDFGVQFGPGPADPDDDTSTVEMEPVAGPSRLEGQWRPSRMSPYSVPSRRRGCSGSSDSSCSGRSSSYGRRGGGSVGGGRGSGSVVGGGGSVDDGNVGVDDCSVGVDDGSVGVDDGSVGVDDGSVGGVGQRAQMEPVERLVTLLEASVERDGQALEAMAESEASMARSLELSVQQGEQHLNLCAEMVRSLQQFMGRRGPGRRDD